MEPANAMPAESSGAGRADSLEVLQFVGQLGSELSDGTLTLPSFPDAVVQIRQVLNDPNATTARVARAVQGEPVFTAKLYRMANSVMLRRGNEPITDLNSVINRLGFETVRNLAVALATRQIMTSKKYSTLHEEFKSLWEHSVDTAAIAFVLAERTGWVPPEDALLAGLIHDIGVFYIYSRMSSMPSLANDPEAVRSIVDDWHTGVGQAILDDWQFPIDIVAAVDEHETLDRTHVGHADLTDVVTVANLLARHGTPRDKGVDLGTVPALERLNLTPERAFELLETTRTDINSIRNALA